MRTNRTMLVVIGVLLFGCGGARPRQKAHSPQSGVSGVAVLPALLPSDRALGYGRLYFGGQGRALVNGFRVQYPQPLELDAPRVPLVGGVQLPARLGNGFLFWNKRTVYRSDDFTGPLERVGDLPVPQTDSVSRVAFGTNFVLFHFNGGGRAAWSPKERGFAPIPIVGLIDVAVLEDGRGLMLKEPGELWLREAGAADFVHWKGPAIRLHSFRIANSAIVVETEVEVSSLAYGDEDPVRGAPPPDIVSHVLGPRGELTPTRSRDYTDGRSFPGDPRWSNSKTPRELAFETGVALGESRAVVYVGEGYFAEVDLLTGELLAMMPSEARGNCHLHQMVDDILATCIPPAGESLVVAGLAKRAARTEQRFQGAVPFIGGEPGTLLRVGTCTSKPADPDLRPSVCVRQTAGVWREFTLNKDLILKDARLHWVPTRDGSAKGLVEAKNSGIVDALTGEFHPFSSLALQDVRLLLDNAEVRVLPGGRWVWYGGGYSATLSPDGKSMQTWQLYQLPGLVKVSGANSLVNDLKRHSLLQSTDHGKSWRAIAVGPTYEPFRKMAVDHCSHVGCVLGDWYRLGFGDSVPLLALLKEPTDHRSEPRAQVSWFTCVSTGRRRLTLPAEESDDSNDSVRYRSRLGNSRVRASSIDDGAYISEVYKGPRAFNSELVWGDVFLGVDPFVYEAAIFGGPKSLLYRLPFSKPRIMEAFVDWGFLGRLFRQPLHYDGRPLFTTEPGTLFPVLPAKGSAIGAFVVDNEYSPRYGVRLHAGDTPRSYVVLMQGQVTSVLEGPHGTMYLAEQRRDRSSLTQLAPNVPELFSLPFLGDRRPRKPDVATFGPDGLPSLIRIWTVGAPTAGDPALVFTRDKPPQPLAPWSTLVAGPCDRQPGYRAIVYFDDWLPVNVDDQGTSAETAPTMARVHWNANRVCLEAVESVFQLALDGAKSNVPASVVIELEKTPSAFRYYFAHGTEYVQPLKCELRRD